MKKHKLLSSAASSTRIIKQKSNKKRGRVCKCKREFNFQSSFESKEDEVTFLSNYWFGHLYIDPHID